MPMPAVMTPKGLLPVNAMLGILEMALIVPVSLSCLDLGMTFSIFSSLLIYSYSYKTLMNAYQSHVMLMPVVMTPKVLLSVNVTVGILEMVSTVLVSILSIHLSKTFNNSCSDYSSVLIHRHR